VKAMETNVWAAPTELAFKADETTHVWLYSLTASPKDLYLFKQFLTVEDTKRADRFKFAKHRNSFIVAHGKQSFILAKYINQQPQEIQFIQNKYGKPFISNNPLFFNLSHSGNFGLLAINKEFEVGVDIEYIRPDFADLKIARRFFSDNEVKELLSLPPKQRKQGFFNCWSRKEAYIKGQGKGLSIPLHQFDVSLTPHKPVHLLATRDEPEAVKRWKLIALDTHPGYAAAVLVNRQSAVIRLWNGDKLNYNT